MPATPIKHGIAVFAACCTLSEVLSGIKIYFGKEEDIDSSALDACDEILKQADLSLHKGSTLYINDWYTSMVLAQHLFEQYRQTVVGTILSTEKKSDEDRHVSFTKLSSEDNNSISKGWFREAIIEMKTFHAKKYYMQCTTWRDKKQVCFLSSNRVGVSEVLFAKRFSKGRKTTDIIAGPQAQADYMLVFSSMDKNNQVSTDYFTNVHTDRHYLIIFCWGLDRVIHTNYVVVCYFVKLCIRKEEWKTI